MKKQGIRVIRKLARIGNKTLSKGARLTSRIENKASRILDGTDFSIKTAESVPFEQVYYNSLPYVTPINPSLPAIGAVPTVTLLIPTLDNKSFFGGTATALVVAAKLAKKSGKKLRIVQTLKTGVATSGLEAFFASENVSMKEEDIQVMSVAERKYNFYGYLSIHPDDIFIASAWWDAHLIAQLPLSRKFIYLVQDFEPIFYNNSDMFVLAEETYKNDRFVPVCNTKLMYDFMRGREYPAFLQKDAAWFEPAVSRIKSGKVQKKAKGEKQRIFLYGRPDVHRNLFFSALKSLNDVFQSNELVAAEWEVYMAGQDNVPDITLPGGLKIKNLGKMKMQEYVDFSKTIDIAVSPMMAPHPNYPTLEFSSIGTAVITTKYENKQLLTNYTKNIIMSDSTSEAMAKAIVAASKLSYEERIKNASSASILTSWDESLDAVVTKLLKAIG